MRRLGSHPRPGEPVKKSAVRKWQRIFAFYAPWVCFEPDCVYNPIYKEVIFMDQNRIGAFIAKMRREQGLTQRELADMLGISDKTVSKWERGYGMPEISLMQPLCRALEIDLNELFSGRKLIGDDYRRQADANLMDLMRAADGAQLNIVGGESKGETFSAKADDARKVNRNFWENAGNDLLGPIVLPKWGRFLPEESELNLLGMAKGSRFLEIGCGNGESLKYLAEKGADEVWGIDISEMQLARACKNLEEYPSACLICTPMEEMRGIPENYFDVVFSVFGLGWTDDLPTTLSRIRACMKPGGIFVFSWSHPIHKCTAWENGSLVFKNSYFDEETYAANLDGNSFIMKNRMLSTYVNAIINAGFSIEKIIENTDCISTICSDEAFAAKAKMLPTAFVLKARML